MSATDPSAALDEIARWLRPGAPDCWHDGIAGLWWEAVSWLDYAGEVGDEYTAVRAVARCERLIVEIESARAVVLGGVNHGRGSASNNLSLFR